jgi:hypothetical protein
VAKLLSGQQYRTDPRVTIYQGTLPTPGSPGVHKLVGLGAYSTLATPNSTSGGPPLRFSVCPRAGGIGIEIKTDRWRGFEDTEEDVGGSNEESVRVVVGGSGLIERFRPRDGIRS